MIGAVMKSKNPRRIGVPATIAGEPNPDYAAAIGPTLERQKMAGDDFTVGGDERTGRRYFMQDEPLDRALKKRIISGAEHSALRKYYLHWFRGAQCPPLRSLDMDRVFAGDGARMTGMPTTEGQVFHRQRWREAREILGHRIGIVVDNVVCHGQNLELAGYAIGYESQRGAITKAGNLLSTGGYLLARHWGIG